MDIFLVEGGTESGLNTRLLDSWLYSIELNLKKKVHWDIIGQSKSKIISGHVEDKNLLASSRIETLFILQPK